MVKYEIVCLESYRKINEELAQYIRDGYRVKSICADGYVGGRLYVLLEKEG